MHNYKGELFVNGSIFMGNSAVFDGGGICCYSGVSAVANSAFVGNTAVSYGGGIDSSGTLTLTSSTVAGNQANNGGGVYSNGMLGVANTIIALNAAPDNFNLYGTITSGSNNLINSEADFVRDPDDGGDGWGDDPATIDVDESANDDYGDIHLVPGSPAINFGSNAWAIDAHGDPLSVDLDGNARIEDGTVDIGAYEFSGPNFAAVDDDFAGLAADASHVLDVLANDIWPHATAASISIVEQPAWGTAVSNPDGSVTYTPYYAFGRNDTFSYELLVDGVPVDTADVSVALVGSGPIPVSTIVVELDADYSPEDLSLREALVIAAELPGENTIVFDADLSGQAIVLQLGQLQVDSDVEIQGPGADLLAIRGNSTSRLFDVLENVDVVFSGLEMSGGRAGGGQSTLDDRGGAIRTDFHSVVTISDCILSGNSAPRTAPGLTYGLGIREGTQLVFPLLAILSRPAFATHGVR